LFLYNLVGLKHVASAPELVEFLSDPESNHLKLTATTLSSVLTDVQHVRHVELPFYISSGNSSRYNVEESEVHELTDETSPPGLPIALHEEAISLSGDAKFLNSRKHSFELIPLFECVPL